ncbi:DUF1284 domain-containing protein [Rhizobium sp. Leaf341]|uniref:DUF1284 domain-containing protein n=1 Tax=Rhizobium sp. Leaf341 TaxID=1736344 RepID=UPI000714BAED|nr:DUF1284 domain-containing protein [Rhizobium sp. Leaf341]KQR73354.1 2Fe-2S ferredoxin [Rhizobium sp. Leaf341]
MTIRLRPHHLLCMLTYVGKGYSPDFTRNYDAIAARIRRGEALVVVDGPDDICRPLLQTPTPHCDNDSVVARDRQAAADVAALLGRDIHAGVTLLLEATDLARLRTHFATGSLRAACTGCEWQALCDGIAAGGFRDVRVASPDRQPGDLQPGEPRPLGNPTSGL